MKRMRFTVIYGLVLCTAAVLLLLDTFVIPHREAGVIEMQPSYTGNAAGVIETQPQDEDGSQANGAMTTASLSPSPAPTYQPQGDASDVTDASDTPAEAAATDVLSVPAASAVSAVSDTPAEAAVSHMSSVPTASYTPAASAVPAEPVVTDTSYQDGSIAINIQTLRKDETTYYVADITLSDATLLSTAFAHGTYGRNINQRTSEIAEDVGAILAINGDYYGFRYYGYVLRNGICYRDRPNDAELLLIDYAGDFTVLHTQQVDSDTLSSGDWWQVLAFGPALVDGGTVMVTPDDEVSMARNSNPRTAMGQLSPLHYVFVVSDGRTEESEGFSLYQLAQIMQELGCETAYNLDGGGSATMVFMGQVVNKPTAGRGGIMEREVSDIVYIGY